MQRLKRSASPVPNGDAASHPPATPYSWRPFMPRSLSQVGWLAARCLDFGNCLDLGKTVPLDQCVCGLWLGARGTWQASMTRAPCCRERVDLVCVSVSDCVYS